MIKAHFVTDMVILVSGKRTFGCFSCALTHGSWFQQALIRVSNWQPTNMFALEACKICFYFLNIFRAAPSIATSIRTPRSRQPLQMLSPPPFRPLFPFPWRSLQTLLLKPQRSWLISLNPRRRIAPALVQYKTGVIIFESYVNRFVPLQPAYY